MRATVLILALCGAGLLAWSPSAHAQDDWSVKRDPFDKKVVARYKRILDKNPNDKDALGRLRSMYKRYRTVGKLIDEYEANLKSSRGGYATKVVLGHLYLGQGESDKALSFYQQAANERPKDPDLAAAIGDMHRTAGRNKEATDAYTRALANEKDRKDKLELLRRLGQLAVDRGDIDKAAAHYQQYLSIDPKDIQVRIDLADALTSHKKYDKAIEILREAENRLKGDPAQRVEVAARIGQTYETAGKDELAIREYKRAMAMTRRGYYLRQELTERIFEIHRRRQTLPSLIAELEKEWKPGSRGHFEWNVLARLYEETGLQEKALEAYKKAVAKAPHELETQRRLIALYENAGREADAIKQYEAVIRVAPGEPRFQLELAQRYWSGGKEKQALAMLDKLARRFTGDAGVHSALADLYTRWGKEDKALDAYQRLTVIEPSEVIHLINLGDQHFQRGDKKKALAVWKKILRKNDAGAHARLGEVYAEHDMAAEALDMYGKAIKLAPKESAHYKGRATVYERRKQFDLAVADLDKALELTPDSKAQLPVRREVRRRIVNLLKRQGGRTLDNRMKAWGRAFGKKPPDSEAGYFLAEAHLRLGQYSDARTVLERLLAIEPDDSDAKEQLVKVYRSEREYDKAIALLEKLASESPGREREYYNQIAEIKTILHQDDQAIEYAQKALAKSPKDPVAHYQLAERYEDMQKYDKAIAAYEKVRELDARNYRAYFALARLYRNADELDKAAKLYREILGRASDDDILDRAGRAAVDLEELTGTLGQLERTIAPLAFSLAHKDVYRVILVQLYERYVPKLVAQARRGSPEARVAARQELERLGAHGLKPLLQALGDERDPMQRRIAISVLGYLGNRGAAQPLVRIAQESPRPDARSAIGTLRPQVDIDMRVEALVAAGRLGDPRIVKDVRELADHPEVAMREAAVFALGVAGDDKAAPTLIAALDDRRPGVQTMACLGLARIADDRALRSMRTFIGDSERTVDSRAACAYALGVIGDKAAVPALIEVLGQGNDNLQRLAAWSLGRIGDRRSIGPLFAAYFAKRDQVRDSVAWALTRVSAGGDRTAEPIDFLGYPMRGGKIDERAAIADLAPTDGSPPVSSSLLVGHEAAVVAGIRDALGRHRDALVRVLEDLDSRQGGLALGLLTARLDEADKATQAKIAGVLSGVGAQLLPQLAELSDHSDAHVRKLTLSVTGKIAQPLAARILTQGLADDSLAVRAAAMDGIADYVRAGSADAAQLVPLVEKRLASKAWRERAAAARALGHMGSSAPAGSLGKAATSDDTAFVREAATQALANLGKSEVLGYLLVASDPEREPVPEVRLAALRALASQSHPDARKRLEQMAQRDPDPALRRAAARALRR